MIFKLKRRMCNSYKIIAYVGIILFLTFINYYHIFKLNIAQNLIGIILAIMLIIILNKYIINKLNDKLIGKIIYFFVIIFILLTIISAYYFRVAYNTNNDYKVIKDSSIKLANKGALTNINYFKIYPNNWGVLIVSTIAIKLCFGSYIGAYAINIISIVSAAIFSVLSAKKIGGNKLALNTIILLVGCTPLYLYAPIVYTDTLSVAVPVATLYFWILAKEYKNTNVKKYYICLITITILGVFGYVIKPISIITFVAIIIETCFTKINKEVLKRVISIITLFMISIILYNKMCEKFIIKDVRKNNYEYPLTHWIMMGLNTPKSEGGTSMGYGAFSKADTAFTMRSGTYEHKKANNIKKINERLNNFGVLGYLNFLSKKFEYIWNDESYYVFNIIGMDTLNTNTTVYQNVIGDQSFKYFRPYMKHYNNALFVMILLGFVIEISKGEKNEVIRVLGISLVGVALFLLIWEARSRYVYLLIPEFCILGAYGVINFMKVIDKSCQRF